jgi:hypothetical protein
MPKLSLGLSPAVVRSLVGIFLLGLGAVTLIALLLPGQGSLTDWWRNLSVPFFGTGRWLLPFVLLLAGWYVEWGPGKELGAPWGRTLLGIALAYAGLLGLLQLIAFNEWTGGRIGRFLVGFLQPLLTTPGAFVLSLLLLVAGLLIAFDRPLRSMLAPATGLAKVAGSTLQDRTTKAAGPVPANGKGAVPAAGAAAVGVAASGSASGGKGRGARIPSVDAPGQTGVWGTESADPGIPSAVPSVSPTSSTFAPARAAGAAVEAAPRTAVGEPVPSVSRGPEDVTDASDSPPTREAWRWRWRWARRSGS